MQILGRKNVRKMGKTSFFGVRRLAGTSASTGPAEVGRGERAPRVRPEAQGTRSRKERAQDKKMSKYNLDVIDEDKRNSGIPKGRLCRNKRLAHRNREHRTLKMSKYNLDEIDEDKRDSIPRKGRKILGGVAPRSEQQDVTRHGMPG